MAATADSNSSSESSYIVSAEVSPDAITNSLRALLPTRHQPIARRRFALLDTFDGRVRRTGARLTRTGDSPTSVLAWQPRGGRGQLVVHLKQPVGFAWDLPDGPLRHALAPVIGVRRLLTQADAEEHGSQLDVLDDRGKTVARLRIASGQVRLPTSSETWQPLPTVVTVTGLRGYEDAYSRLVPVVESRPGVAFCPEGLEGVILRRAGAFDPSDVSSAEVDLTPATRADAGARGLHQRLLRILVANEPGLRANLDTEFLHDFRVTVRRTRALLRQIRHVFAPDVVDHFSTEFSWLSRLTGPARDLDVLMLALRDDRNDVPRADLEALTAFLGGKKQEIHGNLVAALDSERYQALIPAWGGFLTQPARTGLEASNSGRLLADVTSRRALRLSRRMARAVDTIDDQTPASQLHEIRVDAKKLRYLIDVIPAAYDAVSLECIVGTLKTLQRVLGEFNDAHVQEARLLEYGHIMATSGPAGALVTLGRLAEQSRQRGKHLRAEAVSVLAAIRGKTMRRACRRAFKQRTLAERTP